MSGRVTPELRQVNVSLIFRHNRMRLGSQRGAHTSPASTRIDGMKNLQAPE